MDIPGECRWATPPTRAGTNGRTGAYPRDARVPASASSSSDMRGPGINEDSNTPPGEPASERGRPAKGPPPHPGVLVHPGIRRTPHGTLVPDRSNIGTTKAAMERAPGGERVRTRDVALGETPVDWTSFDTSKSMRVLRAGTEAAKTRELRKLHLRWWHATRKMMETTLKAAGVPNDVVNMVPHIIETCRACRTWAKHGHDVTPSVELITEQNTPSRLTSCSTSNSWHCI